MRILGLAIVCVAMLVSAAWAGDCSACSAKHKCDQCAPKHNCASCTVLVSDDLCAGDCCDGPAHVECLELDLCQCSECTACDPCCRQHQREGCLGVPEPENGCWSIDPNCCPRECYRLLCVEREEFRLLCRRDCPKPAVCKHSHECGCEKCEPGLELESELDS